MIAITEKSASKPTDETASPTRYSLIGLKVDDATSAQFIEIARRHCKLALEHGRAVTSAERRQQIIQEIQSLRSARYVLIEQLRASQKIELVS